MTREIETYLQRAKSDAVCGIICRGSSILFAFFAVAFAANSAACGAIVCACCTVFLWFGGSGRLADCRTNMERAERRMRIDALYCKEQ